MKPVNMPLKQELSYRQLTHNVIHNLLCEHAETDREAAEITLYAMIATAYNDGYQRALRDVRLAQHAKRMRDPRRTLDRVCGPQHGENDE